MKLSKQGVQFKSKSTGKVMTINPIEIDQFAWQKLGNKPGIKVITNQGVHHRFGGLKESVRSFWPYLNRGPFSYF